MRIETAVWFSNDNRGDQTVPSMVTRDTIDVVGSFSMVLSKLTQTTWRQALCAKTNEINSLLRDAAALQLLYDNQKIGMAESERQLGALRSEHETLKTNDAQLQLQADNLIEECRQSERDLKIQIVEAKNNEQAALKNHTELDSKVFLLTCLLHIEFIILDY